MKNLSALVLLACLLAAPAGADQKLDAAVAKAEEQIQKGKLDEALKGMLKFADGNPSAEAQLALARVQERTGDLEAAVAAVNKAVGMAAADAGQKADTLAAQAGYDLLRGSSKDALEHASAAVNAKPTVAALATLARAEARAKDGVKALETAEKAVAAAPASPLGHEARGDALLAMGKYDDAAAGFRKALELDPRSTRSRVGLVRSLVLGSKATEAVAEAKKATEADAKSGDAFAALGLALLADNPQANWNDAIAQAQQGAFLNPRSAFVQTAVGHIFDAAGNVDQAAAAYRKVLEVDPGNAAARVALINDQARKGDNDGALAEAKKLVEEAPGNAEAQLLLGRAYLRKSDFTNGAAALEKAAALAPGVAEAQALLGTALQFNRKTDEALVAYKKAVEAAPNNLDYRTTYGLLLGLVGQYEAGVGELKRVVANPTYKKEDAWINLGWVYRNMTPPKVEESVAAYKKALEIDAKNEQSALGLGWAYSYGKNWDGSIAAFEKAIQIEPKTAGEAHDGMAWAFFFKRDLKKAKELTEKAKSEGRPDSRLSSNIEKMEKALAGGAASAHDAERAAAEAQAAYEEQRKAAAKVEELNNRLRSKDGALRRRAAAEIGALIGAQDALPYLIRFLQDPDWGVREQAASSIKNIGCGARLTLPYLKALLTAPKIDCLQCSKEELQDMMHDEDLRREAKEAIAKIEACK